MTTLISKYKIYGRTKGRKKKEYNLDQTFVNSIITKDINIKIKDNNILDIGSGSGENSIYQSMKFPKSKIIACETFLDGNINLCHEIFKKNTHNILIYNGNVLELFDTIRKKNIFDSVWILFPDPWPKKKHNKRRLINDAFFTKLNFKFVFGGKIIIVTDSISYFISILNSVYKSKIFRWKNDKPKDWQCSNTDLIQTKYYQKSINYNRKSMIIILSKI